MSVEEIKLYLSGKIDVQPIGKAMGAAMKILKDDGKTAQGLDVKKAIEELASV
jgi:hypothetical protein